MSYSRRTTIDSLDQDAMTSVMDRAQEVLNYIPVECPTFSKQMLPPNVSEYFWLIFPKDFCVSYLPKRDARVILVDENGEEWGTRFLIRRHGLSGGWRGFAKNHRLLVGDILVFHKIAPCKLKVKIVRINGLDVADGAATLMHIHYSGDGTFSTGDSRTHMSEESEEDWTN